MVIKAKPTVSAPSLTNKVIAVLVDEQLIPCIEPNEITHLNPKRKSNFLGYHGLVNQSDIY